MKTWLFQCNDKIAPLRIGGYSLFIVFVISLSFFGKTESFAEKGDTVILSLLPAWANSYVWLDMAPLMNWKAMKSCAMCKDINQYIRSILTWSGIEDHHAPMYIHGAFPVNELRMVQKWVAFIHTDYSPKDIKQVLDKQSVDWKVLEVGSRKIPLATKKFGQIALIPNLVFLSNAYSPGVWDEHGKYKPPRPQDFPNMEGILKREEGKMTESSWIQNALTFKPSDAQIFIYLGFNQPLYHELNVLFDQYPIAKGLQVIIQQVQYIIIQGKVTDDGITFHLDIHCRNNASAVQFNELLETVRSLIGVWAMGEDAYAKKLQRYLTCVSNHVKDSRCIMSFQFDLSNIYLLSDIIDFVDFYGTRKN